MAPDNFRFQRVSERTQSDEAAESRIIIQIHMLFLKQISYIALLSPEKRLNMNKSIFFIFYHSLFSFVNTGRLFG